LADAFDLETGTITINLDRQRPIDCIGIGGTDGTSFNVGGHGIFFKDNGLYMLPRAMETSRLVITTDATFIGRIGAGLSVRVPTSVRKEPGFFSTETPRTTLGGQVMEGLGGYTYKALSLDSRYKLDKFALDEIRAGLRYIGGGYPFFIDLSDEAYKIPWAYEELNSPLTPAAHFAAAPEPAGIMPLAAGGTNRWTTADISRLRAAAITSGGLWAWGSTGQETPGGFTQLPIRIGAASNWVSISVRDHFMAVNSAGELWGWGANGSGQLGDGTTTNNNTISRIGTAGNWRSVSAGSNYTMGIRTDGSLWGWGDNAGGQLGDGTTTSQTSPIRIGTASNWVAVATSTTGHAQENPHTLAVNSAGELWAWGFNSNGQLGDGTTTDRLSPVRIGTATNWRAVAAGRHISFAIRTDGTLWAWGSNAGGNTGLGTAEGDTPAPTRIGTGTSWASVTMAAALTTNGELFAWGSNGNGQVGDGTTTNRLSPVRVGGDRWRMVSRQDEVSIGIQWDESLWRWGRNHSGGGFFDPAPARVRPTLDGTVTITGTPWVGNTLTANTNQLGGSGDISFRWNWDGSTANTFAIPDDSWIGRQITVSVERANNSGSVTSDPVTVTARPPQLTGSVFIEGTPEVGRVATANTDNLGGSGGMTFQWRRNNGNIPGTNNRSYEIRPEDYGQFLSVLVTRTGNPGNALSPPFGPIGRPPPVMKAHLYAIDRNQGGMSFESGVTRFLYSRRWEFEERF